MIRKRHLLTSFRKKAMIIVFKNKKEILNGKQNRKCREKEGDIAISFILCIGNRYADLYGLFCDYQLSSLCRLLCRLSIGTKCGMVYRTKKYFGSSDSLFGICGNHVWYWFAIGKFREKVK